MYNLTSLGDLSIVVVIFYTLPVILACLYAPNWDDPTFFTRLFSCLLCMATHHLILSGNTKCVLSPLLDGSVSRRASLSKSTQAIFLFLETRGVADVWWFSNPTSRAKAYCSPVHKTYSCIYFIFLDKRILHLTTECDYRAIVTSDHSPLFMKLHIPNIQSTYRPWKFNPLLLSEEEFTTLISSEVKLFIDIIRYHPLSGIKNNLW